MRQRVEQKIKELLKVEISVGARISLRSVPGSLSVNEIKLMLKRRNFFGPVWNKSGDFENEYDLRTIEGNKVIVDHATGLMWHQSGAEKPMKYKDAKEWIDSLNRLGYAGYRDWRLPTIEEGASLLESRKMNRDLHIDSKFSANQRWIWTIDVVSGKNEAWIIDFFYGRVLRSYGDFGNFVRPVRSGR